MTFKIENKTEKAGRTSHRESLTGLTRKVRRMWNNLLEYDGWKTDDVSTCLTWLPPLIHWNEEEFSFSPLAYVCLKETRQTDIDLLTRMRTITQIVEDKCKKPFIQSFCLQDQLKTTVPWCRQTFMFFIWRKPASSGLFSVLKKRKITVWHCHFNAIFMWRNHRSSHVNLR